MRKNMAIAKILSLFFGFLGIDRFYLGYYGLGILKFLTIGGFGFWWLCDFIFIYTENLPPKSTKQLD